MGGHECGFLVTFMEPSGVLQALEWLSVVQHGDILNDIMLDLSDLHVHPHRPGLQNHGRLGTQHC